jgi:hypothetical protein
MLPEIRREFCSLGMAVAVTAVRARAIMVEKRMVMVDRCVEWK